MSLNQSFSTPLRKTKSCFCCSTEVEPANSVPLGQQETRISQQLGAWSALKLLCRSDSPSKTPESHHARKEAASHRPSPAARTLVRTEIRKFEKLVSACPQGDRDR